MYGSKGCMGSKGCNGMTGVGCLRVTMTKESWLKLLRVHHWRRTVDLIIFIISESPNTIFYADRYTLSTW